MSVVALSMPAPMQERDDGELHPALGETGTRGSPKGPLRDP